MTGALPPEVRTGVEEALAAAGRPTRIRDARSVGGGCIHQARMVETEDRSLFLKWNRGTAGVGFAAEARSLARLREATEGPGLLVVPEVLSARDAEGDAPGWLALEYLPPSSPGPGYARRLGEGLALLHRSPPPGPDPGRPFGWFQENRIGPLPQENPWTGSWPDFWRDARLAPQLEAAFREGGLERRDREWSEPLLGAVEAALAPVTDHPPALLHGDLWSGNVHPGPDGRPVLVDPASYLGHGEVDLAMARLFGGFGEETFQAYEEVVPVPPGFQEIRLPLYQLYYLLVHVRLFGGGYAGQTRRAAQAVLSAV